MVVRMFQRRDSATDWTSENPILGPGEIGYDETDKTFRIGDGVSRWADLPRFLNEDLIPTGGGGGGTPPPGGDTTPPSAPTNVRAPDVRSNSIRVAWDAATDNVAVTGYEVTINGSVQAGPITALFADYSGLTPSTNYTVTVRARDAAGNFSPASIPFTVSTLGAPSLGYPDASNSPFVDNEGVLHYFPGFPVSGAESTQALTPYQGVMYSQADDQIIEGFDFAGGGVVIIRHANVTLRRSRLQMSTTYFNAVMTQTGATLAASTNYAPTIEDCVIDAHDVPGGTPFIGPGLQVKRCNIFGADNGAQGEAYQTWEDNFFHDFLPFLVNPDAHSDGVQFDGGPDWPVRDWTFRHNTVLSRTSDDQGTTSCIITNQDPLSGVMSNILIEDNVFAGGAFAIYGPSRNMVDFILRNNKFWTLYYPTVGAFGVSGNAIDLMNTIGNSVGAFSGGLVNNVIKGSWVHDHFVGTPGGTADTTAPSVPAGLNAADITPTSITLTWNPSTDDIGVTGYEVYQDGVSKGVVSVTSKTLTGLTADTTYSLRVRARDAAGNWSAQSSALPVTTAADSAFTIKSVTVSSTSPTAATQSLTTGEDVATEIGDLVLLFQFSDYRLKSQVGLPVGNGVDTATEVTFPGVDNSGKMRVSYYVATTAGAQAITATTTAPADDDKRLVAVVIGGVDSADPIDVFQSEDTGTSIVGGGGQNYYETPAVTTTGPGKLIVSAFEVNLGRTFVAAQDGFALVKSETSVGGFISYSIIQGPKAAAGDTGRIQTQMSATGSGIVSATVALNPA